LGEDGVYHSLGLTEPVVNLLVAPPKKEEIAVSHGVCSDCFHAMVAPEPTLPENGVDIAPEAEVPAPKAAKVVSIGG
jgi:hypothetical protein